MLLSEGQMSDYKGAALMLTALPKAKELLGDKGYDADWFRQALAERGITACIPSKSNRKKPIEHDRTLYTFVGITEGRGLKFGVTFQIHPLEDSDRGMDKYLRHAKADEDFLGILMPDEDSMPCVEREWRIPQLDDEITDVCAQAWLRMGETIREVMEWQGAKAPPLSLDCRHSSQRVRFKLYDREKLIKRMEAIEV
jgi:transposase